MYNDLLGREKTIDNIIKIISASSTSLAFDIEGSWGIGKTFLLDMLKDRLDSLNQNNPQYLVLSYNCWKYDYYEEPLIAIISSIITNLEDPNKSILKSFTETTKNKVLTIFKNIASSFLKNKIGVDLIGIYEDYKVDYLKKQNEKYEFDHYQGFTKAITFVKQQFDELTKDYKIILIIDELDRCLPSYAIKVMERVHHLFEESHNTIVIYSLDRSQLENTIINIFGEKTDSIEYLRKFIDFTITLDIGDTMDFRHHFTPSLLTTINSHFSFKIREEELIDTIKFFSNVFRTIEIRKVKNIIQKIELIFNLILENNRNLDYALVIAILIYMVYKEEYQELLNTIFGLSISISKYKNFREFLDIKVERTPHSYSYLFSTLYDKYNHNIAWILYNSNKSVNEKRIELIRTNTCNNLGREIDLFHKFKEYSEIIK